ncbi:G-type lectin S-receptor-like serine/threonine-protein kinase SD2-5 [Cryptomeria japonica]|uniref:G-type lectin S-receptor-like serine/threonine-protein kinase SD2-5 n=1 Tax=Cryptomeria japonica TaxID=3369 RepID=UPI0027DAA0D5|nr:G-type lectin S-receptor-like serine/threonine-protein kinase SD2-5 [Cryptomeria japonica]
MAVLVTQSNYLQLSLLSTPLMVGCLIFTWCGAQTETRWCKKNAALTLTSTGELVLRNLDGTLVWPTDTSTQAFQTMVIQESGNLVLYNTCNGIMWQSFDHPTDTVLLGQKLTVGQKPLHWLKLISDIEFDNQSINLYSQGRRSPLMKDDLALNISHPSLNQWLSEIIQGHAESMVFAQMVNAAVQETAMLLKRLMPQNPILDVFRELQYATNGFSTKLGNGGFDSVYEGVLSDSSKIAVKRLDRAGQGKWEFRAEVETLRKIDHLNLVRLKGFCAEKAHRMLVYEHLQNGSLDKWIFYNNMHQHLLDWKTRYKIVLNIARGFRYLHEDCREQIIHFDIKPQNILLDQNFNAKVSDFGLAKLVNRDRSEVITMMRGTPGYMGPELLNMHFTEKADIFSFGVMVIEIVSGRRSRQLSDDGLFSLLQFKAAEGTLIDLVHLGLESEETCVKEEAVKLLKVGMWCVQVNFTRWPVSIVVKVLEGLIDVGM